MVRGVPVFTALCVRKSDESARARDGRPHRDRQIVTAVWLESDRSEAQEIIKVLATWQPVAADLAMLKRAWGLQDRFPLSWWDALIIAAAQTCECKVLLTEDLQDGQEFGAVRVINPFATPDQTPEEILATLAS